MRMIDVEGLLKFKNKHVVDRYMKDNGISDLAYAEEVFLETKKFLAACASGTASMSPSQSVDAMWHTFLLFSREYMQFCKAYCGKLIHHSPSDDRSETEAGLENAKAQIARTFGELNKTLWSSPTEYGGGCHGTDCGSQGCCHNDCGWALENHEFFPSILEDGPTVIFANLISDSQKPKRLNVFNAGIGGVVNSPDTLGKAFEPGFISGTSSIHDHELGIMKLNGRCMPPAIAVCP